MHISLYTILYTISGRDVKKNDYVWMYLTWLWSLIRNRVLTREDRLIVFIDTETMTFMKSLFLHNALIGIIGFKMDYCLINQPTTLLEGFFNKHITNNTSFIWSSTETELSDTLFFYCDVDNILRVPIRSYLKSLTPNTIYVQVEGPLTDYTYLGGYVASENNKDILESIKCQINQNIPGFTAGMFAYCFSDATEMSNFFKTLNEDSGRQTGMEKYFEQNSFNFSIYFSKLKNNSLNIDMNTFRVGEVVSVNNIQADTPIISFMGDAGNETLHMEKFLGYLLLGRTITSPH